MRSRDTALGWLARAALAAWALLCLRSSLADVRDAALPSGRPVPAGTALLLAAAAALVPVLAAVAAVRLSRRRPVTRERPASRAALHLGAGVAFAALNLLTRVGERAVLGRPGVELAPAGDVREPVSVLLVYLIITGLAHAVEYARRYRQQQLAELRLQAELARAELQRTGAELRMLKMQLNPHFLFNSLHAVSALVAQQPRDAERMVVRLSDLLRRAMHSVATQEVALEEEIDGLRPFLDVEQIRLGNRLAVEWEVDDEALDALVPHMVLQPLVENSIKHGIVPAGGAGLIHVSARRQGEWLELSVRDDGVGLATPDEASERRPTAPGGGVGQGNVRSRLAQLYGDRAGFELRAAEGGGTVASLRIPWHEEPVESSLPAPAADAAARAAAAREVDLAPASRRSRVAETAIAGAWLLYAWAASFRPRYTEAVAHASAAPRAAAFACATLNAVLWAALVLAALRLTRARPVLRDRWRSSLRAHAGAALALGCAVVAGKAVCRLAMGYPAGALVPRAPVAQVLAAMLLYAVFTGLAHAVEYARRYRQQQLAELRLQAELARAELQRTGAELRMLKMQLNPHFLFNSLHAVSALVPQQPRDAERMVVRLSDLLRRAMHSVATQEVALEEEIDGLRPFLDVEQIRLGNRLAVEWEVEDEALDALVPHMILQPLVENAIKHGIVPAGGAGLIHVSARRQGEWLELSVRDDGVGPSSSTERRASAAGGGVGQGNVRSRLAQLYGDRASFELRAAEGGGTVASLRIPWHQEPVEAGAAPADLPLSVPATTSPA
jgi:two-component system LytT family sensor kinase